MRYARSSFARRAIVCATLSLGCNNASPDVVIEVTPTFDAATDRAPTVTDALALDAPSLDASPLDASTADAPTLDAPALDAPAVDAPRTPIAPVIQVAIQKECREGGLTFTALPTSPFRELAGYRFRWVRTMGAATFTARENTVVALNDATGDAIHFDLTVSRDGYPDAVLRDLWADPCNRNGNPTACPENTRVLRTNQERYAVGDPFEAFVDGAPQGAHWYLTNGLADVVQSDQGRTLRARVAALPILVLAEPERRLNAMGPVLCHGWSARYFFATTAPVADASVDAPRDATPDAPPAPTPTADRIQVQIHQECREGGVKFTLVPTSPFRGVDGYTFSWLRTMGSAPFTTANNAVVVANAAPPSYPGYPIHFDVLVRRPGYPDRTVSDVWSNPCNHDDNPTACPENTRDLVTNQESYRVGDTFDARLVGTTQTVHAPWYVLDGLSDAVFSKEGRHVVARVTSLPVHVHAQPDSVVGMAVCHGWTERWFYAP